MTQTASVPVPGQVSSARAESVPFNQRKFGIWTIRAVTFILVFGGWEVYGRAQSPALFAPISRVVTSFRDLAVESSVLWVALWDSFQALLLGYGLAVAVGLTLGLLMGIYRPLEMVLDPYVSFFYSLPMIVLVPLLIMWLGIGMPIRVSIVFLLCVWPILINTMVGAKEANPELIDVTRVYCASEWQRIKTLILPGALPFIFTGLYVAVGAAILGMVLAELLVVIRGLGGIIVRGSSAYRPEQVFVALFAMIAESLLFTGFIVWLRRRVMPWEHVNG
jgi:ABC-type nitrate/sulfonate/bicarbonate transport system permease component